MVAKNGTGKDAKLPTQVLDMEVRLIGIAPPIWRRLDVGIHHSLAELHEMLQVLMRWDNVHLYEFSYGDRSFEAPGPESTYEDATAVRLCDLDLRPGSSLRYVYDLGDEWTIILIVHDTRHASPSAPVCTGGERAAPPEDAGGVWQYAEVLQARADPAAHPDMKEFLEWYPRDFDPEHFDCDAVNVELRDLVGRAI